MSSPVLPRALSSGADNSMLTRRIGKEIVNYFSGSPLNRVAFLRSDHDFLSKAVTHSSASFILFRDLAPLAKSPSALSFASYEDVRPLIGDNPYHEPERSLLTSFDSRVTVPQLVFLGLDEQAATGFGWKSYNGSPYFALDVTPRGSIAGVAEALIASMKERKLDFLEGRLHMSLPVTEAAMYAQGRALLDWNARNPFCAQCGQPTMSISGGTKRSCPPTDKALTQAQDGIVRQRQACATRLGISNISFPRTDPTVIMAIVSSDGLRTLVGRQKRWPKHRYSTLAGFVEPAESVEEAVRRETWEESGVIVRRVIVHSTQPWPYPNNLMIGAIAQCEPGKEEIQLEHDPELEDARWITMSELRQALDVSANVTEDIDIGATGEHSITLPPSTAIATQLLTAVATEFGMEFK